MMINIWVIFVILIWHWFADFVIQTEKEAQNKSVSTKSLFEHVLTYSLLWSIPVFAYGLIAHPAMIAILLFVPITLVCHFITDYYTSRINRSLAIKARESNRFHDFFVAVGFDQFLHYLQLFLTFYLLTK